MKEFDFDELDKAVNSLMGDVNKQQPAAAASVPPLSEPAVSNISPSTIPETTVPAAQPVPPSPTPTPTTSTTDATPGDLLPAPTPIPSSTPSVSITPRPSGRFMDVVHPSSDMKAATPIVVPSREGVSLQPLTPVAPSTSPKVMNDVIAPSIKQTETQPVTNVETTPEPETIAAPEVEPVSSSSSSEPWSSPFLPDTQVEKRPLGGVPEASSTGLSDAIAAELANAHHDVEPSSVPVETPTPTVPVVTPSADTTPSSLAPRLESEDSNEVSESDKKPQLDLQLAPEFDEKVVPAELNNDLVAIESGKASLAGETSEPMASPEPATSAHANAVLSTSSIPQQYDETPSTGDVSHTPIYDNEAVHQPLNHPAKKKKSWVVIVLILAILLVCGALGGAAYYFGLV